MALLEWIDRRYPGEKETLSEELRITHPDSSVSSLWYRRTGEQPVPDHLSWLAEICGGEFDGADLFSSTFKIAGVTPKSRGGVEIVPSIDALIAAMKDESVVFPEPSIPFMLQAGIGMYGFSAATGTIWEWDSELREVSGQYKEVTGILDEWLTAMESA